MVTPNNNQISIHLLKTYFNNQKSYGSQFLVRDNQFLRFIELKLQEK